MTDEHEEDDFDLESPIDDLLAGDRFRRNGREFEVADVNYTFDIVKIVYDDGEEESIKFDAWLANPPELISKATMPDPVVYAAPDEDADDDGWGDEPYVDDEEARFEQVKEMARAAGRQKFEHVYQTTNDYDYAQREAGLVVTEIITLYETQRLARGG